MGWFWLTFPGCFEAIRSVVIFTTASGAVIFVRRVGMNNSSYCCPHRVELLRHRERNPSPFSASYPPLCDTYNDNKRGGSCKRLVYFPGYAGCRSGPKRLSTGIWVYLVKPILLKTSIHLNIGSRLYLGIQLFSNCLSQHFWKDSNKQHESKVNTDTKVNRTNRVPASCCYSDAIVMTLWWASWEVQTWANWCPSVRIGCSWEKHVLRFHPLGRDMGEIIGWRDRIVWT